MSYLRKVLSQSGSTSIVTAALSLSALLSCQGTESVFPDVDDGGAGTSGASGGSGANGGSGASGGSQASGGSGAGGSGAGGSGAGGSARGGASGSDGCGTVCSDAETCSNGVCVCLPELSDCEGACVDRTSDPEHCGACNQACASGSCSNGNCIPLATGLIGWASVSGRGRATTTGGQGGSVVEVDTASELQSAAQNSSPRIIRISGTLSVSELNVTSNKTLIGVGTNATINGGISIHGQSNIIIQNLRINGKTSSAAGDAINIQNSHHIWIDHCDIWDAPDGNVDITHQSDLITVSWTRFWYSSDPGDNLHRFSNLIGADDANPDAGYLNVTFHHNWWASRVHERMPRVRFGKVHLFNNYFSSSGNNQCVRAAYQANVRVENNYFEGVNNPHEINSDGDDTAIMSASGNTYDDTRGAQHTRGTAFTPPYPFQAGSASAARTAVQAGWGPR